MQDFTCTMCNRRFDSRSALERHENAHSLDDSKIKSALHDKRNLAIAGAVAAGIVIASLIAWRLAKRKNRVP